jgi:hypothetical protein
MALSFRVDRIEYRSDRKEILLTGTVPDGVLVTGMRAWSVNDDGDTFEGTVVEIEHFARESRFEGTRLTFEYGDDAELERLRAIEWQGVELQLEM